MQTETLMQLSEIVDKMDIKDKLVNIEGATNEEVGKQLLVIIVTNIYKVKEEVYSFIASYKNISAEDAKKIDVIAFIKEIGNFEGVKSFLALK